MRLDGDVFTALDVSGVKDRPAEKGAFSVESLFVRYDFTRQELIDSLSVLRWNADLPDPVKTVMHETTHLYHTVTTPFGFLIYALRRLQAVLVASAIRDLRQTHGLSIRYPLVEFARRQPRSIRQGTDHLFGMWYECELFILFALDGYDSWQRQMLKNPYVAGLGSSEIFRRTQGGLAALYNEHARKMQAGKGEAADASSLPFAGYRPDESSEDADLMLLSLGMEYDLNMIFITESAGTVAESWGIESIGVDDLFGRIKRSLDGRGIGHQLGLSKLEGAIRTKQSSEFVLSYLALCDLALSGPVLPHQRHLRTGNHANVSELVPILRWLSLVGVARNVRPMRGLEDYERYVGELCQMLGWVGPGAITQSTVTPRGSVADEIQESIFIEASRYRLHAPGIFQDYEWTLSGEGETHMRFLSIFNFPVIQYRDRTFYHHDKALLLSLARTYLMRMALRSVLLRDRIALRMPYRPAEAIEVSVLRQSILDDLQNLLGIRVRNLTLN